MNTYGRPCVSRYLFGHLSIYLSVCVSLFVCLCVTCLSVWLSVCLPVLSVYLSVCLFFRPSAVCQYVRPRDGFASHVSLSIFMPLLMRMCARVCFLRLNVSQLIFISVSFTVIHLFVLLSSHLSVNSIVFASSLARACVFK